MSGREKLDQWKADGLPKKDRAEEYKRLFESNMDRTWRTDYRVQQQAKELSKEIAQLADDNFRLRMWLAESEGRMDDALAWYRRKVYRQKDEIKRQAGQIDGLKKQLAELTAAYLNKKWEVVVVDTRDKDA